MKSKYEMNEALAVLSNLRTKMKDRKNPLLTENRSLSGIAAFALMLKMPLFSQENPFFSFQSRACQLQRPLSLSTSQRRA
jgi:hypothetical protein